MANLNTSLAAIACQARISMFSFLLAFLLGHFITVSAQDIDTTMLCQGKYWTEAEGKAALEGFAAKYSDKALKASGYDGAIGILGHVEDADVRVILDGNLQGLKSLLSKMGETEALATYQ